MHPNTNFLEKEQQDTSDAKKPAPPSGRLNTQEELLGQETPKGRPGGAADRRRRQLACVRAVLFGGKSAGQTDRNKAP